LFIGGSPDQGRYPASEVNDRGSPEKPVHFTYGHRRRYTVGLSQGAAE